MNMDLARKRTKFFHVADDGSFEVSARGFDVLRTPEINKGTAFTEDERHALGLVGLLPPAILTIEQQAERAYEILEKLDDLGRYRFLTGVRDRNETLFFHIVTSHIVESLPVIYTPTVGLAIQQYSRQFRRPHGIFLSIDRQDEIEQAFRNADPGGEAAIDLVVATDAEAILGIGDWGVGGIDICVGKLSVYTAAGGIDPQRAIPVVLDVGTDRQSLLEDPLYLGYRHPRVRGDEYRAFIDTYISTVLRLYPNALLHWEDLGAANARWILDRYRSSICTFNDDIQGTAGTVLAAVTSALKVTRGRLRDQTIVVFGAGTAGCGIADLLVNAMIRDGMPAQDAARRFWCIDRNGLLVDGMPGIHAFQGPYARPADEVVGWECDSERGIVLDEVVRQVRPTILIGSSGVTGAFTEPVVREMAKSAPRPIILPLSNPTALTEATPADLIEWTEGKALIATGSPFPPVVCNGVTYAVAQSNNAILFPGLGLGTIAVRARLISDAMFMAAARAIADMVNPWELGASILPPMSHVREVSVRVAVAVAEQAVSDGLARAHPQDVEAAVRNAMWEPRYRPVRAI
ncbi:MAG TPA: NAD-dependent malic enzyme [Candidatus Baltobacteraceae bacterium]|nr:NAD-dependent malic enzyme [Candidatus Baltobacteraceae bacterium]